MGYSTWNDLQCDIHEDKVKHAAASLLAGGFQDLGYTFINVDDCWMAPKRGRHGELRAWDKNFPSGMAALGQFIHERGFKYGLYTSRGRHSCSGLAGSLGHEAEDTALFAAWGADFLKNDGCFDTECFAGNSDRSAWQCGAQNRKSVLDKYRRMRDGLNATRRRVLYEVCGWEPWYAPVGGELGHMFRIGADVQKWEDVYEATQLVHQLGQHSGPGAWVHPDMLLGSTEGAAYTLAPQQSRAQFTLWATFPAPLILGTRAGGMSEWDRQTYSNEEVIAVNQDPLGRPASRIFCNCGFYPTVQVSADGYSLFSVLTTPWATVGQNLTWGRPYQDFRAKAEDRRQCQQVWARVLHDGDLALAAVNFAREPAEVRLPRTLLPGHWQAREPVGVRDLWRREDIPIPSGDDFLLQLPGDGGYLMLRLSAARAQVAPDEPPTTRRVSPGLLRHGPAPDSSEGTLEVAWTERLSRRSVELQL